MAKCIICNSRKGKRKCRTTGTFICSMCCGETREAEKCAGCSFSKSAAACRNYKGVPYYSTEEMADSPELEDIAHVIETTLCEIWEADGRNVNDRTVARLVELTLDEYHFNDGERTIDDPVLAAGHRVLSRTIRDELNHVEAAKLVKVLAAVYRSIQRRTVGGSSYLEFIRPFTGIELPSIPAMPGRVGTGNSGNGEEADMSLHEICARPPWEWPEETGKIVQEILADRAAAPDDRLLAAEMAGDMVLVDDDIAETLLRVVADNDDAPGVRARTAIALGPALELGDIEGFDDPEDMVVSEEVFKEIQESLRKSYDDPDVPKEVRRRILEAAVRAPETWQRDAVKEAFANGDPEWQLTAVFCMRFIRGFERQILEALRSDNPDIRYQAVSAAGNWGIEATWPEIAEVIEEAEEDDPLLFAAIEAAANLELPEAIEPLQNRLIDCDDDDLIDALHEALAMLGAADFIDEDQEEDDW